MYIFNFFQIRVLATDGGSPSKSDTTVVSVSVTRNLFSPEFPTTRQLVTITENQIIGDPFSSVTCNDPDTSSPNNQVTYTIGGTDKVKQYFQVGGSTGQISLIQPLYLDADDDQQFGVLVTCSDLGTPSNAAVNTATVLVSVQRNLNAPTFLNTPYNTTISSNTAPGTSIFNLGVVDGDAVVSFSATDL